MTSRLGQTLVAALTALAVLALGLHSGLGYTYCVMMERAQPSCCCPKTEAPDDDTPLLESACCEARLYAELPAVALEASALATLLDGAALAPEPVRLAIAPALRAPRYAQLERAIEPPPQRPPRAGPSQRLHRVHSVFLL